MKTIGLALVTGYASGCLVAAVGAGIGAVKYGSAKQKEAYATYTTGAQANNTEREKADLDPIPIMTFEEWKKGWDAGEAEAREAEKEAKK